MVKTRWAAGGIIRSGKVPNPVGVTGVFVNPIEGAFGSHKMKRRKKSKKHGVRTYNKKRTHKKHARKRVYSKKRGRKRTRNAASIANLKGLVPSSPGAILKADTWMDVAKTAGAAGVGYAMPGIIEVMTNQWLSKKMLGSTWFKERAPQKAAAVIDLGTLGASMYIAASYPNNAMVKQYALPYMVGLGVRTVKDALDAFLGTVPDSFSMNVRSVFGLTASPAGASIPGKTRVVVAPGTAALEFTDANGVVFKATLKEGKFYDPSGSLVVKSDGSALLSSDSSVAAWGLSGYFYDKPAMSGYFFDKPALPAGDLGGYTERSFGDMGAYAPRSFGDMGAWSENQMVGKNPFDDPIGDAGF